MPRQFRTLLLVLFVQVATIGTGFAQAPVAYRLSFPEPYHRWMQVEIAFADVPAGPFELHMSRSSPGRYALHEFAKNVFDVAITDATGELAATRPNPHEWLVSRHGAALTVRYRVFGDRVDGTYLAVDTTHAHINMPAALMWARGFEDRPVTVHFERPSATSTWRVATQLFPTADAFTFTAPNLQYLMDSPTEFGAFALRSFTVADAGRMPTFRIAAHHQGTDAELDALAADVRKIVEQERQVFGEFAPFDTNTYTFVADYLPWASGDGMEHRNSTIVVSSGSIRTSRPDLLSTVAHEFFHSWNVERIRPKSLEPFDFTEANMSGELWLAEGFTNYYGPLSLQRAGLTRVDEFAAEMGDMIDTVITSPGRRVRTAEEMSRFAPFVDAAAAIDRTNFSNTFISYYTWGGALGIGLDLTLRERSNGEVTLDHFMRELWRRFGKPGGRAPGYVDRPYTMADLKDALAAVSDAQFAETFFARYIQGHDVLDYAHLLSLGGLVLRPVNAGEGFAGTLRLQDAAGGVRLVASTPFDSPAYAAGLDRDDVIVSLDGMPVGSAADFDSAIRAKRPGTAVPMVFERRGQRISATLQLIADPRQELVPVESTGQGLTPAQRQFRQAWLSSR